MDAIGHATRSGESAIYGAITGAVAGALCGPFLGAVALYRDIKAGRCNDRAEGGGTVIMLLEVIFGFGVIGVILLIMSQFIVALD
jgi:hypothetical protein